MSTTNLTALPSGMPAERDADALMREVEDIIRIGGDWADNASLAEAVAALHEAARRAEAVPFAALRRADIVEMGGEEMILLDDAHRDGDTCWTVVQRAGRPTAEKITRPADTVVRLVPREVTRQAANAALSQILPEGGDRRGR